MTVEAISDTIHRLKLDGQEIVLVGTAHVSQNSVEEVRNIIETENPDRICIELDSSRLKTKTDKADWENMDIRKVFKEGRGFFLLANTALASFQKRMGAQTGINPGEEILSAASIAKEKDIPLSLCDRDIQTTFKRAWAKSSLWNKCKLLATLISAAFSNEKISESELEELKKQDTLQAMMNEMAKELPMVKEVLIDERDQYLGRSIFEAEGTKKVAIIGAGHTNGVISTIEKLSENKSTPELESLTQIPKGAPVGKILSYVIPPCLRLCHLRLESGTQAFSSLDSSQLRLYIHRHSFFTGTSAEHTGLHCHSTILRAQPGPWSGNARRHTGSHSEKAESA